MSKYEQLDASYEEIRNTYKYPAKDGQQQLIDNLITYTNQLYMLLVSEGIPCTYQPNLRKCRQSITITIGDHRLNLRVDRHYIYCEEFLQVAPGAPPMSTARLVRRLQEVVSKYQRIYNGCGGCWYSYSRQYCGLGMDMLEGCGHRVPRDSVIK